MQLNFEQLQALLVTLGQTSIAELNLKTTDLELTLRRETGHASELAAPQVSPPPRPEPAAMAVPTSAPIEVRAPAASVSSPLLERKWQDITSPMVGTFYRAPAPDEPPFVDVGDRVRVGQTVCIIEAMKLMNELESEVAGEIMEVLVQNGQPVEFGQVLMRVNAG